MAFFNQPQWRPPSLESLADYLGGAIDVSDVGATKVKKLSLQHSDPEMAEYLLRTAYNEAAELVRAQDRQRIELERDYLLRQLGRVSLQLNRDVLIRLLADREQRLMLTDNSEGYLGQVIDPVRVSSRPRPLSTNEYVILPTIIAFLMSALLVTVIFLFRNEGRRS